jgi:hypothetical protein
VAVRAWGRRRVRPFLFSLEPFFPAEFFRVAIRACELVSL